jgi:hypothetical protein
MTVLAEDDKLCRSAGKAQSSHLCLLKQVLRSVFAPRPQIPSYHAVQPIYRVAEHWSRLASRGMAEPYASQATRAGSGESIQLQQSSAHTGASQQQSELKEAMAAAFTMKIPLVGVT